MLAATAFLLSTSALYSRPGLRRAQHLRHHLQRRQIGMQRRRNVIDRHDPLNVADAAQHHGALAFLRGLHRVRLGQHALRLGDGAEVSATIASAFDSSNCPAMIRSALSGW